MHLLYKYSVQDVINSGLESLTQNVTLNNCCNYITHPPVVSVLFLSVSSILFIIYNVTCPHVYLCFRSQKYFQNVKLCSMFLGCSNIVETCIDLEIINPINPNFNKFYCISHQFSQKPRFIQDTDFDARKK